MFHKGKHNREKQLRFSIRKVSFGAASVAVAALFMFLGNGAVSAAEQGVPSTNGETQAPQPKDQNIQNGTYEGNTVAISPAATVETNTQLSTVENNPSPQSSPKKVETLDKKELTDLIKEIDGKLSQGTYATKTEESVNNLRTVLEEARTTLNNAKTQAELSQAHANLVVATTKLQTKPEEKKEVAAVDTTNGKATVGKKATNTEKSSESNSIANSGSKDKRNGKVLDTNNPFRTDAATTDTDPAAHQTYTEPAADANLETLSNELKNLPNMIENNKKIQNMDTLGNALKVEKGSVTEINEFGGWKAVGDSGKFAIARKTEAGVFPIETVNTVWQAQSKTYQTWVLEQSFNRDSDYMLFLSKVRTKANSTEEAFDNSEYKSTDEGKKIAKGVKGFNGIQKTFKAYSKEHGSKVIVSFKTGYTGDIDGTKAQYKVEVIVNRNGHEEKLYDQTFRPEEARKNTEMTVVKASDGTNQPQNFITPGTTTPTKAELEAKIANNKPNGTGGTFTSKEITLPEGVTEYTVRISSADNQHLGMGYQSPYRHYALPVTGLDFNIDQDTGAIAKDLLSRIYEKLKATETADTDGKTNETKAAYLAELENIKTLVTSTNVKKTAEYKVALESILSKQLALKVDKTGLTDSKASLDDLVKEDPTPGKTKDTATAYNAKKQDAIKAIEAAKTVIDSESATVAQVREALATVNAKKEALQQAKDDLIEAATAEEKAKLKTDAAQLTKADETGKTPDSIAAYEAEYEKLKTQLEEAKSAAAAVEAKGNNASKTEAQEAQAKVDAAKTALDKAAESLVNKADKAELTQAKEALNTLATEADPTTGKTADSAKAYNDAKTAAQEAIKEAETVINNENATPEQVTAALEKVNAKKAALQQAKDGLIEAATAEEKAKLKADAAQLTKADETGKTPDSIAAYEAEYEKLKAQLEEAKAAAAAVEAKGDNATKAEVQEAQAKVDAAKTALDKAAESLVNKADKAELKTAKEALNTLATAEDPTTGKTADSAKAYNDAKTAAQEAVKEAETVINNENATPEQVTVALNKVNEKKAALESAKQALVEAATAEEKAKLKADAAKLTKADETGKTPNSIAAYEAEYEKLKAQLEEAKAAAAAVEAKGDNASKTAAQEAQAKVDAAKTALDKAAESLVNKADKAELKTAKEALNTLATEADPTTGKTADSAKAYNDAKTAAQEAIKEAETVINNENATPEQVTAALEKVNAKKAALQQAKDGLIEAATAEEKAKLKADAAQLTKADETGKTSDSIAAYEAEYEKLKTQLEEAKAAAAAVEAKGDNATKSEVQEAQAKVDAAKTALDKAAESLVNKADKAELTTAKEALNTLATEADPTTGKTADSAKAYNDAKTAAQEAIKEAETVINNENATPEQVTAALNKVNEKKSALDAAKQALVEAATAEEKAKLKADAAQLTKADETGKTSDSIAAYEAEYEKLKTQLEEAKSAAAAVEAKGDNATKAEAQEAQAKVDAAKTALDKAAESLVNKADKAELTQAKEALNTLVTEADPTTGKTADSAKAYTDAKTAAQEAIKEAETVINNENATPEQVTAALNKVNEKKAALEKAKQALVEAATAEEKAKLKAAAAQLTKADETGKTPDSIAAYEAEYGKLKTQLEEAKAAAAAVEAKGDNATKAEAQEAQAKVDAAKTALDKAAELLVNKADKAELTQAKDALNTLATEADPTTGKTADSAKTYNDAKTAAQEAIKEAETVINNENATPEQVTAALNKVNEKKAALQQAKDGLIEAATAEEKAKLKADAAQLTKADETGKTPDSIAAYEAEYGKLKTQLEEAKAAAAAVEAKGDNATKAEAQEAQAKVDAVKTALDKAAELLVNKADKAELTQAKEALNTLVTEADPTTGKTADSAKAYNDAKTAAQEAIKEAETVINNENATPEQVTAALNKVNEKKTALEKAKQALVEAATAEEKAKLKADAAQLTKADETGKTPDSIAAYEAEYEKLKTQLEEAKAAAAAVEAKGNNASKTEAQEAQAKVDAAKTALDKAAESLVNKADKAELTQAKEALNTLATEADPITGKTADSAKAYNDAKTAAQEAIKEAETVINNENATPEQVTAALNKVNEKKAALQQAKDGLIEAATAEEKAKLKAKLKADAAQLTKADETGKTPDSIAAYEAEYGKLKTQLEEAKAAAAAVEAKGDNATKAEAQEAQAKVDAAKTALDKAAELLVNKADKAELTQAKEALNTLATEADPTTGKTADSAKAYNDAKTAAQEAIKEAETVINNENAIPEQVTAALEKVNAKKAALQQAKDGLIEAATAEEKAKLKADAAQLTKADETGKTPDSIAAYEAEYGKLKTQLEEAKAAAAAVEAKGDNATKAEAQEAQAKVDVAKTALDKAAELLVNKADKAELTQAKEALNTLVTEADPTTGKTADSAKAYNDAKTAAQEAIKEAETVINNENAIPEQVTAALEKVNAKKAALQQAKDGLIEAATAEEKAKLKADAAQLTKADETGKTPDSIAAYEAEYGKLKTQLEEAKAAAAAVEAKGDNATKAEAQEAQAKVDAAKTALDKAAELLKDLDRDGAKKEIAAAAKKAIDAIEASTSLTPEQKTDEKAKVAKEAKDATDAIDKATTEDGINSAKDKGKLAIEKEVAITAINAEKTAKEKEIDNNSKLSDDEKAAAKAEVAKAALAAVNAINEAKDQEGVDGAQTTGVKSIEAVTPVGKEKALEAIQTASEAKIASIDKNAKLSGDEKAAAKAEVAKAALAAVNDINEAKDQDGVDGAQTTGVKSIEAVNPVGKEKALEAIQTASEAKIASIDKNAKLSDDEKAAAKAEVAKVALAAVNAINEAKDQEGVDGAQTTGVKSIEAVNPVGTSSTVGEGNVITPPTVEVPEYTDPVGTSSTDGAGNLITPPTVEVPAYTDPVGTSSTDGEGNLITPPTAEVPAYTDPVGTSSTDGAGNLITPPTAEVPAYTEPVGTSSTDGEGNVIVPPTAEVPAYTGSVNGISEEMPAQPHKDGSANEMSDGTTVSETTINKDRQLPNTGTADSTVAMVVAAASALLGLGLAGRRRKEDEEA